MGENEICDLFGTKGLKLGTQANKNTEILKEKKELPEACETTLAKKKADNLPAFVMNTLTSYF